MGKRLAKKLLLIGWDAADWKIIHPLMDQGLMPSLNKLVNQGVIGNLATLNPPLSPMLWTSIATGKRPYKHGIHGFSEVSPNGKSIRPIYVSGRKSKAIWNILGDHQLKTHQVAWWPSHPAEKLTGISVSNFFQRAKASIETDWPMLPGTVQPQSQSDIFQQLRFHPQELTAEHILPFIPHAASIDQEKDKRLLSFSKILADTISVHNAATYILENEEWDLMCVYYDAIDHFSHLFMKYHPPKRSHIKQQDFDLYKDCVTRAYQFHDMMLERLVQLAGEDAHIMLVSDHGFHPDHLRPKSIPKEPAGPAIEHSPFGIFCLSGPGIKADETIYGASLLDLCPTILQLFGLPIGKDMDGKVLVNCFEQRPQTQYIPTWEVPLTTSAEKPSPIGDEDMDKKALQQLIDLGYVEDPGDDLEKAIEKTKRENNFFLAQSLMDGNQMSRASTILQNLVEEASDQIRYHRKLFNCHLSMGEISSARTVWENMLQQESKQSDWEERKGKAMLPYNLMEIRLLQWEGETKELRQKLQSLDLGRDWPNGAAHRIGLAHVALKHWKGAEENFAKELEKNPQNNFALHGLGLAKMRQKQPQEALEHLLDSVGLQYYQPLVHFHLGECLTMLGEFQKAKEAYQVCLKLNPGLNAARLALAELMKTHLQNPKEAERLLKEMQSYTRGEAIVVSGLPRSGTSLLMQLLKAAKIEIFSDGIREADASNTKGYFEHEKIKGIGKNPRLLLEAKGMAVKVVVPLVQKLPPVLNYKVIFMDREIQEVLLSQHKMLARLGKGKSETINIGLQKVFEKQRNQALKWIKEQPNISLLEINFSQLIQNPKLEIKKLIAFIGQGDLSEMLTMVDPSLQRERLSQTK